MALAERDLNAALGKVMRGFRGELRYSQREMGLLLGIGQRTVSDIEKGERGLSAYEVLMFPEWLAKVLPYSEANIRSRLLESPHLRPGQDEDGAPPDSDASNLYSLQNAA